MCGIAGYIGNLDIKSSDINKTLNLMKNRGPDSQDYCVEKFANKQLLLLHSRLEILDLKPRSNQPFKKEHLKLIFNGEIYNFKEIRNDLIKKGYKFFTKSDTEVLLNTYIEYEENCVNYFEGMWSFAIWDSKNKKLFLSRDRFGEKPLFFFRNEKGFFFGSEIKYIKSLSSNIFKINEDQLIRNLIYGYKSINKKNETFFKNIYPLESGTNLSIDSSLNIKKSKYWNPIFQRKESMSFNEACEGVKYYLSNSVKIRLRSDVPLAFCLSGGVDSSLLASIASKNYNFNVNSFSIIDKDERYNEKDNISETINDINCQSKFIDLNYDHFINRIEKLIHYHECPIATISYYVHSFLSEAISSNNFKVAISGTGADEQFTGYYEHYLFHLNSVKNDNNFNQYLNDWKKHALPFIRNPSLKNPNLYLNNPNYRENIYDNYKILNSYLNVKFEEKFLEKKFCDELLRNRMLNEMFYEVVPVILHHDDLNSMSYSIENRSPYLDKNLFEFTSSIPSKFLIMNGYQKMILRQSAKEVLNDKVRLDRRKIGFNASINSIVNFKDIKIKNYFFDKKSKINEYINIKKIEEITEKENIDNYLSKFLFSILNTKIFLDQFG